MPVRNAVRALRQRKKLSSRQLAQAAGVHYVQLSRVERQIGTCSDDAKIRIAVCLDASVAEVFYPDYVENPSTRDARDAVPA